MTRQLIKKWNIGWIELNRHIFFVDLILIRTTPDIQSSSVSPSKSMNDFDTIFLNISLIFGLLVASIPSFSARSFFETVTQLSLSLVFTFDTIHRNIFVSSRVHFVEALAIRLDTTIKALSKEFGYFNSGCLMFFLQFRISAHALFNIQLLFDLFFFLF